MDDEDLKVVDEQLEEQEPIASQEEARNRLILAGVEAGKIDIKDALKILGGELNKIPGLESQTVPSTSPTQTAPRQTDVYNDDILDNEPEAWGGRPRG